MREPLETSGFKSARFTCTFPSPITDFQVQRTVISENVLVIAVLTTNHRDYDIWRRELRICKLTYEYGFKEVFQCTIESDCYGWILEGRFVVFVALQAITVIDWENQAIAYLTDPSSPVSLMYIRKK